MSRQKRRARAKRDIPPVVRALMQSEGIPIRAYKKHGIYAGKLVVTTTQGALCEGDGGVLNRSRLRLVE